ncbi:MAG TPA: hypothetical protein VK498_01155 [Ferruginibacter sp.]|nr:hypothetical protein [Ferruginibacter sp.]
MNFTPSVLLIGFAFILSNTASAQLEGNAKEDIYFYVVRHAEKDTGRNPGLLAAGLSRAGDLFRVLKDKHIDEIYVTQTRRSMMTADSLRIYRDLKLVMYEPDTSGHGLLYKMNERNGFQKDLLIIGHSNTIPGIIRSLGITGFNKEIPDSEHDKIYIIHQKKGKVSLKIIKYGKSSEKSNDKMKSS